MVAGRYWGARVVRANDVAWIFVEQVSLRLAPIGLLPQAREWSQSPLLGGRWWNPGCWRWEREWWQPLWPSWQASGPNYNPPGHFDMEWVWRHKKKGVITIWVERGNQRQTLGGDKGGVVVPEAGSLSLETDQSGLLTSLSKLQLSDLSKGECDNTFLRALLWD